MEPTLGKFEMEKFDGKGDFGMWKYKLLGQLEIQGLLSVLQEEEAAPGDGTVTVLGEKGKDAGTSEVTQDPKRAAKDLRVKSLLGTCLSDTILRKIMNESTARGMWKALERDYQTKSLPNRIYLKQMFASYKMEESKTIEENLDGFLKLIADLASLKVKISDEDKAIQVLSGLPPPFEPLVHTLKYGMGKDTITLNEVITSAYAKEVELKQKGLLNKPKQNGEDLYVETRGRSEKRSDKSKGSNDKGNKNRSKSKDTKTKPCWVCGDENHWKRDCPQKKKTGQQPKPQNSANVAVTLPYSIALTASLVASEEQWVLDSGCTFNITPRKDLLSDLVEFEGNKVLMGNNTQCTVKGMGTITIDNQDGSVVTLSNVRYIPEMGRNLISYGQLEQSGCKYSGKDYTVQFYKGDKKVLTGKYEQGLYYLQGTIRQPEANVSKEAVDMTKRWHTRLAHMSQGSMETLARKGYLKKEDVKVLGFCEACTVGKSHKQSFLKAKYTTKGILGYVHSDLWGSPNVTPSLSGAQYFITFINDFSKKVWIYFLRTKDEAYQKFVDWKVLVENQTGKRLKCLRTDNGLEFCNNKFDKICSESGVKRHKTCPYTPQQNGVSERMNITIMDKVRSMLAESGLKGEFWVEAASTTVHIIKQIAIFLN